MSIANNIVGSWFPSGYHGHYRSKARNDFVCEYRQLAKPQPPKRFVNRAMIPRSNHTFSRHDNRHSFLSDATSFNQGTGKKKHPGAKYEFHPDFYTWMPLKQEIEHSRPLTSTYKTDFSRNGKHQLIVRRPVTSFDDDRDPTTTYRYTHGLEAPNRKELREIVEPCLKLYTHQRRETSRTIAHPVRESVATCMSWYRPHMPASTPITDYCNMPSVPPQPKTTSCYAANNQDSDNTVPQTLASQPAKASTSLSSPNCCDERCPKNQAAPSLSTSLPPVQTAVPPSSASQAPSRSEAYCQGN